ncbi:MAG TPA: cyanophycin synthetase, partial [Flavobacteriales bacterium]|nr:cyanophycin synthetase [Flavobacteriales bacterium]
DEFDRSFLTISPDIAVITSVDADHLDIYQNKEILISSFSDFTNKIKSGGTLFIEENIDMSVVNREDISVLKYGSSISSDCKGTNIFTDKNTMKFQVECNGETFADLRLNMGGVYNVMNAVVSVSVANLLDVNSSNIIDSINTFMGIKRRFETHISSDNLVFIDDYAHHPKEVKECINAVKQMYPERKVTVVFQPHLYSRTKDFLNEFAKSLSLADELILLNIYGAREQEIEGVSSQDLLNKCISPKKELSTLNSVVDNIADKDIEVLLTLGAGDISTIIEPLRLKLS